MLNIICSLSGLVIVALFAGGLAHSIWNSTGDFAFPVITLFVLILIFIDFLDSVRAEKDQS